VALGIVSSPVLSVGFLELPLHVEASHRWKVVVRRLLEKNGPSAKDIKRLNVIEISLWEIDYRAAGIMVKKLHDRGQEDLRNPGDTIRPTRIRLASVNLEALRGQKCASASLTLSRNQVR
jgi:hypothetical protein